ncbi:hypothetical protein [Mucilaginibacter phyllosphaerae]
MPDIKTVNGPPGNTCPIYLNDMKKINKNWHLAHVMPKNASLEQRIAWHLEHQENCGCRPIPKLLLAAMEKRKAAVGTAAG